MLAVRRTWRQPNVQATHGCHPTPVTALWGRIRRRSVTRVPPSTRSKRTSSTRQQSSHSPQPPALSRSLVDEGRGGSAGPWSSTLASTQASPTRTATSTGSPPPDPCKMALVAASSRASSNSSATWVGSSPSASRAARRRPASSNGEAEIVSSTPDPLPEAASFGMVHPGSSPSRVGLTRASQQPRKVGSWQATASALTPRVGGLARAATSSSTLSTIGSRARPSCLLRIGGDLPAASGAGGGEYFYVAVRGGVCPLQVQDTTRGPALPGVKGPRRTGLLGTGPEQRRSAWPRAEARGHVVHRRDGHP